MLCYRLEPPDSKDLFLLGTYMIAMALRAARKSVYTAVWLRNLLADFGVAVAIFAMVLASQYIFTSEVDMGMHRYRKLRWPLR